MFNAFFLYADALYNTCYMETGSSNSNMKVDIDDFVFFEHSERVGDTYIFEPSPEEKKLGRLLAAVEVDDKDGIGEDFFDTLVHALQREYYRDPKRGILASFESALHQANLILYDMAERGVRDWMGSLHMSVLVLSGTTLHVSTAGEGIILLARRSRVTEVGSGLSHSPITDPLRTFSQVASGVVIRRDVLFIGTSHTSALFKSSDLTRLITDYSAATITMRLQQLYQDQRNRLPVAILVVSILPHHLAQQHAKQLPQPATREPISTSGSLLPRQSLKISRSLFKHVLRLVGRIITYLWIKLRGVVWPFVKQGSQRGSKVLFQASRKARRSVLSVTTKTVKRIKSQKASTGGDVIESPSLPVGLASKRVILSQVQSLPRKVISLIINALKMMPSSSKLFAVLAIILAVSLVTSLFLLQNKRAEDAQIQMASELLHEARTKKEAADTALIYDNRDQTRSLLSDAQKLLDRLAATNLYQEQTKDLQNNIVVVRDRLDKVTRVPVDESLVVGDFSLEISPGSLKKLFYLNNNLYTFDSSNNSIVRMTSEGVVDVVSKSTQGIGFFTSGTIHEADKTLILMTDTPGIALYDTKTELLHKQEIDFPSSSPEIMSLAVFGNRLYVYDRAANNIYGYSKTLRGYSGGNAWITDGEFSKDTINSIGVDGYVYTLHEDGTINKLLKGTPVEFSLEKIEPRISGSAGLLINEDLRHLYVLDKETKRVIIFDTKGNLNRQIQLGEQSLPIDIAVDSDETTVYILDGTKVIAVSLVE